MEVSVALAGGHTETVRIEDGTYADLLREVGLSPQAATVLVDGQPVPADAEVEATEVQVLRLISGGSNDAVAIEPARTEDAEAVIALLDGAMLEIDRASIRERIGTEAVLVARKGETLRGAVVVEDGTVTAIAVNRRHRGRGIGSALIEAAADRHDILYARFGEPVKPFYETLGFDIRPAGDRFVGTRCPTGTPEEPEGRPI